MDWNHEENAVCYGDEPVTIKSTADQTILFAGILRDFKFTFKFTPDNLPENNTVECSIRGLSCIKYYPLHILGAAAGVCKGQYDRIYEDNNADYSPDGELSQHTYSFETANGDVLLTARLLKCPAADWFETNNGSRRRRPPYGLLSKEKTMNVGYADNVYIDPIKSLIAAGMKNCREVYLSCDERSWFYAIEEHIAA